MIDPLVLSIVRVLYPNERRCCRIFWSRIFCEQLLSILINMLKVEMKNEKAWKKDKTQNLQPKHSLRNWYEIHEKQLYVYIHLKAA